MFKFARCPVWLAGMGFHCTTLVPPCTLMVPGHPSVLLGWTYCHTDSPVQATSSHPALSSFSWDLFQNHSYKLNNKNKMKLIHSGSLRSGVISRPCQGRLGFGYKGLISAGIVEHKLFNFFILKYIISAYSLRRNLQRYRRG